MSVAKNEIVFRWHGEGVKKKIFNEMRKRFSRLGKAMVSAMQGDLSKASSGYGSPPGSPPFRRTGELASSIYAEVKVSGKDIVLLLASTSRYALLLEVGGTVTPTSSKALAVPISAAARAHRGGPRTFPARLTVMPRQGREGLLVEKTGGGRFTVHYALKSQVTVHARPFFKGFFNKGRHMKIAQEILATPPIE